MPGDFFNSSRAALGSTTPANSILIDSECALSTGTRTHVAESFKSAISVSYTHLRAHETP